MSVDHSLCYQKNDGGRAGFQLMSITNILVMKPDEKKHQKISISMQI